MKVRSAQGELTVRHDLWSDTMIIGNGHGYDYHLPFAITVDEAAEIMSTTFGFDESEIHDLKFCINYVQDYYKTIEIT